MAAWYPTTPFEEEVLALQPDHNFIYGDLTAREYRRKAYQTRPREHLNYLQKQKVMDQQQANEKEEVPGSSDRLRLIRAVHKIAGTKQMGMDATLEDWDTQENATREMIAMIRHFGMGPSVDLPLNKKTTRPTLPIDKQRYVTQNGKQLFPVLLDDESFKIVSTRMRNAEAAKALQESMNGSTDTSKTDEDIVPVPYEEEKFETFEEAQERAMKEFVADYPTLEKQKVKSKKPKTKIQSEPESWRAPPNPLNREPENWRIRTADSNIPTANYWRERRSSQSSSSLSYSSVANMSTDSDSIYYSLNNTASSDDFVSAKEQSDNSFSGNQQSMQNSFAQIVQHTPKPPPRSLDARFHSPRDVYYKNRNQRKMI